MAYNNGVIYNLAAYLRIELPTYTFYINKREPLAGQEFVPDECVLLLDTGGDETGQYPFDYATIQVLTKAIDAPTAKGMANAIHNLLHMKWGLQFPAITVKGVVYPILITNHIQAIQPPSNIGTDENGLIEFSNNYQIYYTGK